jgi:hypothetical protein
MPRIAGGEPDAAIIHGARTAQAVWAENGAQTSTQTVSQGGAISRRALLRRWCGLAAPRR